MPETPLYVRNPKVTSVARGDSYMFIRPDSDPLILSPTEVAALSELLCALVTPMAEPELMEHADEEMVAFLVAEAIVIKGSRQQLAHYAPTRQSEIPPRPCGRLVFGLTGAIASAQLAVRLRQLSLYFCDELDVILTEAATHIVRPELIEYLGLRAWTDAFSPRGDVNVPHIHLASAADLIVVMPASAHTLYKLAHGACSDLLSLTIAATAAPVVLVPAMNHAMWGNPAIARNVAQLRSDGIYVVDPGAGSEVSRSASDDSHHACLGGMGIYPDRLQRALTAILVAHRDPDQG